MGPSPDELRHHFLWRFWPVLPGWGGMALLDRSLYGHVPVERVEELTLPENWRRAYEEIVYFERSLAAAGTIVVVRAHGPRGPHWLRSRPSPSATRA